MYERILEEIKKAFKNSNEISQMYNSANEFELSVLILRSNKCDYGQIQNWLGSPSKKKIREVLLKYNSNLIDLDCNRKKLKQIKEKASPFEFQAIINLNKNHIKMIDLNGWYTWKVIKGRLFLYDINNIELKMGDFDETTQQQILNTVLCTNCVL